jgi:hypothetical protein
LHKFHAIAIEVKNQRVASSNYECFGSIFACADLTGNTKSGGVWNAVPVGVGRCDWFWFEGWFAWVRKTCRKRLSIDIETDRFHSVLKAILIDSSNPDVS